MSRPEPHEPIQRGDRPVATIDASRVGRAAFGGSPFGAAAPGGASLGAGLRAVDLLCREGLTLRRLDYRIELVGATPALRRLLEVTGLDEVLPCAERSGGCGGSVGSGPRSVPEPER